MYGFILSDPARCMEKREKVKTLLKAQQIPLTGFTEKPSGISSDVYDRNAFLRHAARTLMQPGEPLPMEAVLMHLSGDALPGNVVRRYVCLQLSLLPYLRADARVTQGEGCFLLGEKLLVAPVSEMDTVDVVLPLGKWTDIQDGQVWQKRLRVMRGYQSMPVLVRENTLLPVGVEDMRPDYDEEDRLTLHWYQPEREAACTLASGISYHIRWGGDKLELSTDSKKPCHLIIHRDGQEILIR